MKISYRICKIFSTNYLHFLSGLCIIKPYYFESWGNMVFLVGTCLAFILYIVYDVNSVLPKNRFLHSFFTLGTLLLAVSTIGCFIAQWNGCLMRRRPIFALGLLPAIAGFFLMIRALFFSIPFYETYLHSRQNPTVYDRGMYALCRHPGVLWLCLMYFGLSVSWGTALCTCLSVAAGLLDIIYVVFQDCWTFPCTFSNYREYQKSTPFLIPTPQSIQKAWHTRK